MHGSKLCSPGEVRETWRIEQGEKAYPKRRRRRDRRERGRGRERGVLHCKWMRYSGLEEEEASPADAEQQGSHACVRTAIRVATERPWRRIISTRITVTAHHPQCQKQHGWRRTHTERRQDGAHWQRSSFTGPPAHFLTEAHNFIAHILSETPWRSPPRALHLFHRYGVVHRRLLDGAS